LDITLHNSAYIYICISASYISMKHILILIAICSICTVTRSQVGYVNKTDNYWANNTFKSLNPVVCMDINHDLIDDIVCIARGVQLVPFISPVYDDVTWIDAPKQPMATGEMWSVTAAYGPNGIPTMVLGGAYNTTVIAQYKDSEWQLSSISPDIYTQGSNLVDVDQDGDLDYFACHDDAPSVLYLNNNGNYTKSNMINFGANDPTDGSGNYGSEWSDVNGDFLPDLYIAKCRAGVDDPMDKRRINTLYINNGNGSYTELADSFGIASGAQSWVGTFGDLDNDGDMDLFLGNHYSENEIYENINNQSFRKVVVPSLPNNFPLQALIRDMDNNGLQDIIMAGVDGSYILWNKGNWEFAQDYNPFIGSVARSIAVGDINDDGFLDAYVIQNTPFNMLGALDQMFISNGNGNNYFKVSLLSPGENSGGVGSHLSLYGPWGKQVRYVKSGESYGISNSLQQHFGLGASTTIDSLVIVWPDGKKDKFIDIDINSNYLAQKEKCISKQYVIYDQPIKTLTTLTGPLDHKNYKWSSGETTPDITVSEKGLYTLVSYDNADCRHVSKPVLLDINCLSPGTSLISSDSILFICTGDTLEIATNVALPATWSDGSTNKRFYVTTPGLYSCTVIDDCGTTHVQYFDVVAADLGLEVKGDTVAVGAKATLVSSLDDTKWYGDASLTNLLAINDTLVTTPLSQSKNFYAVTDQYVNGLTFNIGEKVFSSSPFGGADVRGDMVIYVRAERALLRSFLTKANVAGRRKIVLQNLGNEADIREKIVFIPKGDSRVSLDFELEPNNIYQLKTDSDFNTAEIGSKGPQLARTIKQYDYPISDTNNIIDILPGDFGIQYYYYFYDLEVMYNYSECRDVKTALAYVDAMSSTDDELTDVRIYPSLTSTILDVRGVSRPVEVSIINLLGHTIAHHDISTDQSIDVAHLSAQMYMIKISAGNSSKFIKFIKI
jgi:hypothetical protein